MTTGEDTTPRRERVAVGELEFDVTMAGRQDAPAILLLHGFPQTAWSWRHVVPVLAGTGRRVLALDQRGYSPGASPDGVEAYAGEHLVDDVLGVLDALGLDEVDLVGHDWGAAVAWQVAGLHPARVRTLTCVSVPHPGAFMEALKHDPDQRARSAYMRDFAAPGYEEVLLADGAAELRALFGEDSGVDVQHVVDRLGDPAVLRRALNWYAAQSAARSSSIPPVEVPTLHVWSDGDTALGEYGARATERFVTGPYRLEVLHGVSHWIPEQAPERLAELVAHHVTARD